MATPVDGNDEPVSETTSGAFGNELIELVWFSPPPRTNISSLFSKVRPLFTRISAKPVWFCKHQSEPNYEPQIQNAFICFFIRFKGLLDCVGFCDWVCDVSPRWSFLFGVDLPHVTLLSILIDAVDVEFRDVDVPTHKKLCQVWRISENQLLQKVFHNRPDLAVDFLTNKLPSIALLSNDLSEYKQEMNDVLRAAKEMVKTKRMRKSWSVVIRVT